MMGQGMEAVTLNSSAKAATEKRTGRFWKYLPSKKYLYLMSIPPESIKMAITIVVTVPILVVYPFLQKYFVKGMTLGAVKS
jgi:ABC-type glycerol-3-phosphate transport system permease component